MTREETLQAYAKLKAMQQLLQQRQAARQQQPQAQPQQDLTYMSEDDSALKKFGHGLALSGVELGLGVKDLFTKLSDNDKKVLEMMRRDAQETGGWGTAGRITGEVGQLALPAGVLAKAAKAKNLSKLGLAAGELGIAAAHGGFMMPEEGQSRTDRALESGLGALVGMGAGKVLGKTLKGFTPTKAAQKLIDEGITLTPGQASKSGFPRGSEYVLNVLPFTAKSVERQRERAVQQMNKVALNKAAPEGVTVTEGGHEGIKQLKTAFPKAYKKAWEKAGKLDDNSLLSLMQDVENLYDIGDIGKTPIKRLNDKIGVYLGDKSAKNLDMLDNQFRKEIKSAWSQNKPDLAEELGKARSKLRQNINPQAKEALENIDKQYGKYSVVKRATESLSGATPNDEMLAGFYDPKELLKASVSQGKKYGGKAATGEGPLQDFAGAATASMARKEPNPLVNMIRGVSRNIEVPFLSDPIFQFGSNVAMGRTSGQQAMRAMADYLRRQGFSATQIGAGLEDESRAEIEEQIGAARASLGY
jgi:hypothetical protein